MAKKFILAIDQSTSSTKAMLFDEKGALYYRYDIKHNQIILPNGWIEHDANEIYDNLIKAVKNLIEESGIDKSNIKAMGISNQRETSIAFRKNTGEAIRNAIVWQCSRSRGVCQRIKGNDLENVIKVRTGLNISPHLSAPNFSWMLENDYEVKREFKNGNLAFGNMDSYLLYRLTNGKEFKSDYSNASRTLLLNLQALEWDSEICKVFKIDESILPKVVPSDSVFGYTNLEGLLTREIPILAMMGDSHAALFAHGCLGKGDIKVTYGTGSSVMMNIGDKPMLSNNGLATSVGFGLKGKVYYVLEGNINYAGAVIKWLQDDLHIIDEATDVEKFCRSIDSTNGVYLVPAFSGLGAPHWDSEARAIICGMNRETKKEHIVRAALESIAYQVNDIVEIMQRETGVEIKTIKVDGGAIKNKFLMQFQSNISQLEVDMPQIEEFSGAGVAIMAGIKQGLYNYNELKNIDVVNKVNGYMKEEFRMKLLKGWRKALALTKTYSRL